MMIGLTGSGKTTLTQALYEQSLEYKKTQAIEVLNRIIDTPGEYLENMKFHRAFLVTAADADVIILMQACNSDLSLYPAQFATMFTGKDIIGVVSKTDLAKDGGEIKEAERQLLLAGASRVFKISSVKNKGVKALRKYLNITK